MKYLNGEYYVEVKDHRYKIHPTEIYYTVNKVRDENRDIDSQYENDDNDYININDFILPNRDKHRETILR